MDSKSKIIKILYVEDELESRNKQENC